MDNRNEIDRDLKISRSVGRSKLYGSILSSKVAPAQSFSIMLPFEYWWPGPQTGILPEVRKLSRRKSALYKRSLTSRRYSTVQKGMLQRYVSMVL